MLPISNRRGFAGDIAVIPASRSSLHALIFLVIVAGAVLQQQRPVRAQALDLRDGTGNTESVVFDNIGGHHACVYGYYGPPVPYFADPHLDNMSSISIVGTCQIK
jgi:hypothetical protein